MLLPCMLARQAGGNNPTCSSCLQDSKGPTKAAASSSTPRLLWVFEPDTPNCLQGSAHLVSLTGTRWQLLQEEAAAPAAADDDVDATGVTDDATNSTPGEGSVAAATAPDASKLPGTAGCSWLKAQQQGFAGGFKGLVGHRVAVWWPDDKRHYEGVVTDYYHAHSSSSGEAGSMGGGASSPDSSSGAGGSAAAAEAQRPAVGSKRKGNDASNAGNLTVRSSGEKHAVMALWHHTCTYSHPHRAC